MAVNLNSTTTGGAPSTDLVRNADGNLVRRKGIWGDIDAGQEALAGGVRAYGDILRPELLQTIGTAFGGLNEIGALRSGATTTALNDITTNFADRIGAYAASTAAQGADLGLQVRDRITAAKRERDARRGALLRTLGSALGAGIGFVTGGPAGAMFGAKLGETTGPSWQQYAMGGD